MAIQVTEKKKEIKIPKGVDILFQFGVVLLVVIGLAYLATFYLSTKAVEEKKEVEQSIENKKAEIPEKQKLEETARYYRNLIDDFQMIVKNNRILSPFFQPFQKMVHPEVILVNLSVNLLESQGSFMGQAEDIVAVGQQFMALKDNENIRSVSLESLLISGDDAEERKIDFSFVINVDKDLFNFNIND